MLSGLPVESQKQHMDMIIIYFDGGCQPNPGKGYGSYETVSDEPMLNHKTCLQAFGERMTCNMAEYMALISALKWLSHREIKDNVVKIYTDSMLVCNQVKGRWKTKLWFLKDLKLEVLRLLGPYKHWQIHWVPRQSNVDRFGH